MRYEKFLALICVLLSMSQVWGGSANPSALPVPAQLDGTASRAKFDPRVRQYILPKRIVWQSSDEQSAVENAENLLKAGSGQVTLDNPTACTLRNKGKAAGILLDFGRELSGGIQIMVSGSEKNGPVRLRVRFGESVSEAMSEVGGEKNATNDHAVRDQTCLVPWLGTHEIGNTGFRFVRIDLVDQNSFVQIKSARAVFIYRDLPYQGSFRCSDERLNRIWQTGAYTVHLNMQDYLWDGIKRDRLVWIGDMHPETMTIGAVFGSPEIVPASLDLIRNETPLPKWMNGISSYSMWWILIHHSWYRHNGDLAYLREQKPYLTGLLQQLIKHIGPDNRETLPEMRFLDWPSSTNKAAIHAGLQSLMIMTLEAGADIGAALDDRAMESQCKEAVARLRKHVPDHGNSKQAAALMALAGLGDAGTLNRQVMAVDGAKRMSTFYGYYVLQARAMAGDYQGSLDCIRDYWGAMLDLGATTFWEDFDLDWMVNAGRIDELVPPGKKDIHGDYGNYCYKGFRHSLSHGWASGLTPWLTEHVLGIRVVEPGCKAIRIEPHLADLQWAEGTFPTPLGVVKVRHEKAADGSVKTTVDAPPGVRIVKAER
ncbi:MAG TPA: alpha-L-rhamnosidase C-terminal domain-containing protein [Tepidisphaeraceae bacterium]|nr:alpha-L-rhamnosidase C-terminal domain-containing protein [Tepidisphaeraceae bacterium]